MTWIASTGWRAIWRNDNASRWHTFKTLIKQLESFPSRYGVPVISQVETGIFTSRYYAHCTECAFCQSACCLWGVDVDIENVRRIRACADALEAYTGVPRAQWFEGEYTDPEFPGGRYTWTRVLKGACVFLSQSGRGCLLHRFAVENGLDYHELKPMVSCLFPLTFGDGILCPTDEAEEHSLICLDSGPTLYRGIRSELTYYFGDGLVAELDELEAPALLEIERGSK